MGIITNRPAETKVLLPTRTVTQRRTVPQSNSIVLITGNGPRHRYFTECLNARFPIAAVWRESVPYPAPAFASDEERQAWDWFFARRQEHENNILNSGKRPPALNAPQRHSLIERELAAPATWEAIAKLRPGFIALFGTSLVPAGFLARFPGRVFNLHVGRPAFYRGSSCNFWPIHDRRLECLGAAVHRVDAGIDTGEVIAESGVSFEKQDDEQSLSARTWVVGTELMAEVIASWLKGEPLSALAQPSKGKLYRMKDFTPQAVLRVKQMVESGELAHQIAAQRQAHRAG